VSYNPSLRLGLTTSRADRGSLTGLECRKYQIGIYALILFCLNGRIRALQASLGRFSDLVKHTIYWYLIRFRRDCVEYCYCAFGYGFEFSPRNFPTGARKINLKIWCAQFSCWSCFFSRPMAWTCTAISRGIEASALLCWEEPFESGSHEKVTLMALF